MLQPYSNESFVDGWEKKKRRNRQHLFTYRIPSAMTNCRIYFLLHRISKCASVICINVVFYTPPFNLNPNNEHKSALPLTHRWTCLLYSRFLLLFDFLHLQSENTLILFLCYFSPFYFTSYKSSILWISSVQFYLHNDFVFFFVGCLSGSMPKIS